MENIDKLKEIWQEDNKNAKEYYNDNKENITKKAKKQSNNIISKVKKNLIKEYIIGILSIPLIILWLIMYDFNSFSLVKKISIVLYIAAVFFAYLCISVPFLKQLKKTNLIDNVVESINLRIDILSKFLRKVKIYSYVSLPLVIILIVYVQPVPNFETWFWIHYIIAGFGIIFAFIMFYVIYVIGVSLYNSFYGNYLKYLKSIRDELVQEVDTI